MFFAYPNLNQLKGGIECLILPDAKRQACIDACNRCYQTGLHEAMNHCLEADGKHVVPDHFRLMKSCAEICHTSTHFMLSNSTFSWQFCKVYAEVGDPVAKVANSWTAWKGAPKFSASVPGIGVD